MAWKVSMAELASTSPTMPSVWTVPRATVRYTPAAAMPTSTGVTVFLRA